MREWIWIFASVVSLTLGYGQTRERVATIADLRIGTETEMETAVRILQQRGGYNRKVVVLPVVRQNIQNPRVFTIVKDLLLHYYQNPRYNEEDSVMYYDDVIAEELLKILGSTRSPDIFPVVLRYALYHRWHRVSTVQTAWQLMQSIEWR